MNIFSLWDFICTASEQMLAQKNAMFWLHGLGVRKKTVNSVKIAGHFIDFFRRSQKENILCIHLKKKNSASTVKIYSVNSNHKTTFLTLMTTVRG